MDEKLMGLIQLQSFLVAWTFLIAYSKSDLKNISTKASPYVRPF
jgi:hypothetical protein